jgi:phosphoribosylformimino-5-aminoimidazole carboxamide ribotide isomerase
MAVRFSEAGAEFIHVVDLDGARSGGERNLATIKRILAASKIPIEVGGGIRSMETVSQLLDLGVSRVILGSAAVDDQELVRETCKYFPHQMVIGIDARNGEVALHGWGDGSGLNYIELAKQMAAFGVRHIIFTDIGRDGMLSGVNVEATAKLARESGVKVVASGGVHDLADVKKLMACEADGIEGCIIGKAIYTGAIDLKAALALVKGAAHAH